MSTDTFCGTRAAAALLGVRANTLQSAVWSGRIAQPRRGPGRAFLWSRDDLDRAARCLRGMTLRAVLDERQGKNGGRS